MPKWRRKKKSRLVACSNWNELDKRLASWNIWFWRVRADKENSSTVRITIADAYHIFREIIIKIKNFFCFILMYFLLICFGSFFVELNVFQFYYLCHASKCCFIFAMMTRQNCNIQMYIWDDSFTVTFSWKKFVKFSFK